jgi:hypothetical protein
MTTLLETRQDSLTSLSDGNTPPQALLRMGIAAHADKWDLLALQGRMFTAKQTTIGTAIAGSAADNAGIVLTAPTFRFTVPTGTTVFPRHLNVAYATAAGVDNEIAWIYSQTDSYTSDGTAITPLNLRTDAPRATAVTSCRHAAASAIVEAALTNVRVIHQDFFALAFTWVTSYDLRFVIDKWIEDFIPIVGPASVLLYLSAKSFANTHYMSMDWAEVPTISAITHV